MAIAARRANRAERFTPQQVAWVSRVEKLGANRASGHYDPEGLAELAAGLVRRLEGPEDLRHLGRWLAEYGVALVVELPLQNSKMDGMASLVTGAPVIGLSTRGDRMDGFVFTLLHEIAHLVLGHVSADRLAIDEDLDPNGNSENERAANDAAASWIFKSPPRLATPPTPRALVEAAEAQNVHVCFLIGRLQNQGLLDWKDYRRVIPKVRPFVELG